jgi:Ras GTPase-activating protein 1
VFTVTVTLYNKGKRGKDAEVAEVTLELAALRNTEETEEWFQLSGVTPIGKYRNC